MWGHGKQRTTSQAAGLSCFFWGGCRVGLPIGGVQGALPWPLRLVAKIAELLGLRKVEAHQFFKDSPLVKVPLSPVECWHSSLVYCRDLSWHKVRQSQG